GERSRARGAPRRRAGARAGPGGSGLSERARRGSRAAARPSLAHPFLGGDEGGVALADHVAPGRVELEREAAPARLLGRDQATAGAAEGLVDDLALLGVVEHWPLEEEQRLLRGMRRRCVLTAAADRHDRRGRPPDSRLLAPALPVRRAALAH